MIQSGNWRGACDTARELEESTWSLSLEREEMWPRQNMPILNTLL